MILGYPKYYNIHRGMNGQFEEVHLDRHDKPNDMWGFYLTLCLLLRPTRLIQTSAIKVVKNHSAIEIIHLFLT